MTKTNQKAYQKLKAKFSPKKERTAAQPEAGRGAGQQEEMD